MGIYDGDVELRKDGGWRSDLALRVRSQSKGRSQDILESQMANNVKVISIRQINCHFEFCNCVRICHKVIQMLQITVIVLHIICSTFLSFSILNDQQRKKQQLISLLQMDDPSKNGTSPSKGEGRRERKPSFIRPHAKKNNRNSCEGVSMPILCNY